MKQIDPALLNEMFAEWQAAPGGGKSYTVQKQAEALGIALGTLYKMYRRMGFKISQRKEKRTKGQPKIKGLIEMAEQLAKLYAFVPARAGRKAPLEEAIQKALENGMLPEEARNISVSTFARVFRQKGLLDMEGRMLRFEAAAPMEQVQYDVSGSEYLYVADLGDGDPILRVRASKGYKNKDRYENYRVWYHAMIDDHSRYWLAMPYVAAGEASAEAIRFCKWAFARKEDERIVFRGLPGRIYMDNGPLAKSEATRNFFERQLGVEIKTHEPESPTDTGKIERKWRQLWSRFEVPEFLMDPCWNKREYRLSEVRARLMNYIVELNAKKHPNMNCSKVDAWRTVMRTGGVIDIEESAFDRAFTRTKRCVGKDGIFSLENEKYFVKGLLDAEVWVYRGIIHGSEPAVGTRSTVSLQNETHPQPLPRGDLRNMVVEDCLTHKRYDVEPFEMPGLDEIRRDKMPEGVRIRQEADEMKKRMVPGEFKGIYESTLMRGCGENIAQRVPGEFKGIYESTPCPRQRGTAVRAEDFQPLHMPVRTRETREVADVFDVDIYHTIADAMKEFVEIVGVFIGAEERATIEGLIIENGMKKQYVIDLALEIQAARERKIRAV